MYAAIRQGTAKAGTAEELARKIKEGAIPIISDVPGFQAYYVISTVRPGYSPTRRNSNQSPAGAPGSPARIRRRSISQRGCRPLHEWIELVRTADGDHATEHAEVEPPDARGWLLPPPRRPEPRPAPPRLPLGLGDPA